MWVRIVTGVVLGGGIGLAVGMVGKSLGGQCALLCNPYISTGLGVFLGLFIAAQSQSHDGAIQQQGLPVLGSPGAYQEAVEAPGLTLVTFYTDTCTHCHRQMPILGQLAEEAGPEVTVATANARTLREIAREAGVRGVPTTLVFSAGRRVETLRGVADLERLREVVRQHTASAAPGVPGS